MSYIEKESNNKILGFKNLIKEKGFNQVKLANELGVSQVLIWKWINRKCQPQLNMINKLAYVLNCTTDEVLKSFTQKS